MKILKRGLCVLLMACLLFSMTFAAQTGQNISNQPPTVSQTQPPKEEQQPMPSLPIGIAQVYQTTGSKSALLQQQDSIAVTAFEAEDKNRQTVYVDSSAKYQSFIGYGASLTHASAYLLMQADEATRASILQELL